MSDPTPVIQSLLSGLPILLLHLACATLVWAAAMAVYMWITPHDEFKLIRAGNEAAAISLGGASVGLAVPLAFCLAGSVNVRDVVIWGSVTLVLQLIAFRLVTSLDAEAFADWGWRLPFLASGVLMIIGLAIRFGVEESPEFKAIAEKGETAKYPVLEVLRTCKRQIFYAACAVTIGSAGFFFTNTFMLTYVTQYQGISRATILDCLFLVTILQFISQPISALLAERIGEGRFLMLAALLSMAVPYPMFLLVGTQNLALMTLGIAMAVVTLSGLYAVIAGYMAQAFPAHLRYSGISIAYQLICAIAGGSTPIIGTLLATRYAGQWLPLAIFFSLLAGISLFGVCGLARLRGETMAAAPAPQPAI